MPNLSLLQIFSGFACILSYFYRTIRRAKFVSGGGAKIFGLVYFSPSSLLTSNKKKSHRANLVYFTPSSMLISKKRKKGHLAKLFYLFPSFLMVSKKKAIIVHTGHFRWAEFLFRGAQPHFAPPSCGPVYVNMVLSLNQTVCLKFGSTV